MNSIIGTIVDAGTDDQGTVRLVIHTEEGELKKLTDLPIYAAVKITIERCAMPETVTVC